MRLSVYLLLIMIIILFHLIEILFYYLYRDFIIDFS